MYTTNEEGVLNNYAVEPQMYFANYPTLDQQRRYAIQGGLAVLMLAALVLTSVAIS